VVIYIPARCCREQTNRASILEVIPLLPEGEEEQEVSKLLVVIVVELVDYDVVKVADELAEHITLIIVTILEIQPVVEDVAVRLYDERLFLRIIWQAKLRGEGQRILKETLKPLAWTQIRIKRSERRRIRLEDSHIQAVTYDEVARFVRVLPDQCV